MLKLRLGLLVMCLCAGFHAACGGGSAKADGSAGGDAPVGPDGVVTGSFITGDVDGVTVRAEMMPVCGTVGLPDGQIWAAVARTPQPTMGWTLYMNNSVGKTDCPVAFIMLSDFFGDAPATLISNAPGASCSVTVTAAAPAIGDFVEGTFTLTLPAVQVTNGAFRVRRDSE